MEPLENIIEINEESQLIAQPKDLKISLYNHQLSAVYEMEQREKNKYTEVEFLGNHYRVETNMGVLADKTGYGKSLTVISLILRDKMKWIDNEYFIMNYNLNLGQFIKAKRVVKYDKIDTTLIVANHSIIHQWREEFSYTPLKVNIVTTRREIANIIPGNDDVIICTITMYNELVKKFNRSFHAFKRFIFDEPGQIRVPKMEELVYGFIWLITATPKEIINCASGRNNHFFDKLFCWCSWSGSDTNFAILKSLIVKNSDGYVTKSFEMPKTIHTYHKCYQPLYKAMTGYVPNIILEMIAAGNVGEALEKLGCYETTNITQFLRSRKEKELDRIKQKLLWKSNTEKRIKELKSKEEKLVVQLDNLEENFSHCLKDPCSICMENLDEPLMFPCCQKIFCTGCIITWYKTRRNCPLCRTPVRPANMIHINLESRANVVKREKLKTKQELIIDIINKKIDGKFIIFSNHDRTFKNIFSILEKNHISYSEIKGTIKTRENSIKKFNEGNIPVIFLNSKNNGAGINLQKTTDIILYHKMSESIQTQTIGRANRIGRMESLTVHHLE